MRWHHNAHKTPLDALAGKYVEEDRGHETPCWIWTRCLTGNGRPNVRFQLRMYSAYRLSYEAHVGPIPEGYDIDHLCRQPTCINPAHLEPVTGTENRRRAGQHKLNPEAVRQIKELLAQGERQVDIAARFGVSQHRISQIKRGKGWEGHF